ncbi:MAG: amidohydrolase family protein [Planctomycetota bacterium]|nr:amidohydrolase family protein [Planctomycetota bacterium]MDA1180486.1 amidohydrolase family protein [Planctomycetota bacterium]
MKNNQRLILDRRQILQAGLAATCLTIGSAEKSAAASSSDTEESRIRNGWIDAHVHIWTPDVQAYPLAKEYGPSSLQPPSFTPVELMTHAAPCDVTRVVLIQMSFYGFDNKYMLDVIAEQPSVYRGVAVIDTSQDPRTKMAELRSAGVRGFRIGDAKRWRDSLEMRTMWTCGAEQELAMCLLINPQELPAVSAMCRDYPRTPVVIDHIARIGAEGTIDPQDLEALSRLADFDRVRVKLSAFYALGDKRPPHRELGPMIEKMLSRFGRERLMWATDCPYQVQGNRTYRDSIDLIRTELDFLSNEDREWILRKTAEAQFFAS